MNNARVSFGLPHVEDALYVRVIEKCQEGACVTEKHNCNVGRCVIRGTQNALDGCNSNRSHFESFHINIMWIWFQFRITGFVGEHIVLFEGVGVVDVGETSGLEYFVYWIAALQTLSCHRLVRHLNLVRNRDCKNQPF